MYHNIFPKVISVVPRCCVETQEWSLTRLSVEAMPSASGLHLEATHREYRCLRIEKRVEYGWVTPKSRSVMVIRSRWTKLSFLVARCFLLTYL
jgi:hypothetical protein